MFVSKFKKGFTLAEILVTLMIVGVIAALAVPSLINDTQETEFKVSLKKSVAVLNQALTMSMGQDNTDASSATTASGLMNIFSSKLNVIKTDFSNNMLTTVDGIQFTFYNSSGTSCDSSTTTEADKDVIGTANCAILVDTNGEKNPNVLSSGGHFKDQYYLIVRAKTVIPAKTSTTPDDDMAQQAMYK